MANNLEFYMFRNYNLAVKAALIKILYLSQYPPDQNVKVLFATPVRTYAKILVPLLNGSNLNPTCSFYMTSNPPAPNQTPGGYFTKFIQTGQETFNQVRHPLPFELTYRITLWTNLQAEMDILLWQLYNAAPRNRKYHCAVDGQWCEMFVNEALKENDVEPGESKDSAPIRYGIDLVIPRAYIPLDYLEYRGIINEVDLKYGYEV